MSISAFATITGALVALMEADVPVAPVVMRARDRLVAEQYPTAVAVSFDGSAPFSFTIMGAPVDWESRYSIECWSRTTSTTADLAVDPLFMEVYSRLAADTTLGGLVSDIAPPTIEAEYSAEQQKTGWVRMSYVITHRTKNLTLEAP